MNLTERLRRQALARPDAPAVVCGSAIEGVPQGRVYSYAELDRIVDALAIRAAGWGIAPDEHVVLLFRAQLPVLLLRLSLARAGLAFTNVAQAGDASVRIRLHASESPREARSIIAHPNWWSDGSDVSAPMCRDAGVLLQRQGTSGTTGAPKLVPVTQAMYAARWGQAIGLPLPHDPRLLCVSGPGGLGFGYALSVFERGGTVVLVGPEDNPLELAERHRANVLVASPRAITSALERRPSDAPPIASLEQVVLSGSRLTTAMLRLASERIGGSVVCMYGSTEAGPLAAGLASSMPDVDGAAGFLLPGVDVQAVDEHGNALPPGRVGTLRMRAPGMAREYFRDREATARAFRDGWFYPNDYGTVMSDGALVVTGRADDLINVGGSKIAPEAIEGVILGVPGVRDAAAFGVPDALGRQVVHVAIVADGDVDPEAIRAAFRGVRNVAPPSVLLRVARLPRNDNGKLVRSELVRHLRMMRR